jgi:hypothetical protein
LEVLRQENELLRNTITETQSAISDLENGLVSAGKISVWIMTARGLAAGRSL